MQGVAEMSKEEIYKAEVREMLQLDYSMQDDLVWLRYLRHYVRIIGSI